MHREEGDVREMSVRAGLPLKRPRPATPQARAECWSTPFLAHFAPVVEPVDTATYQVAALHGHLGSNPSRGIWSLYRHRHDVA